MTNQEKIKRLFELLDEIDAYRRCLGKVQFDMECCAPEDGLEQASEDMALVGKRVHELTHSEEYARLVCELNKNAEGLSFVQQKTIEHLYESYARNKNLSADFSFNMDCAYNKAYADWLKAKKARDFSLFAPSFKELVAYAGKAVELRDEKKQSVYDTLLDDHEKGGSIAQLDAFFAAVKDRVLPLMKRIQTEGKPIRGDFLTRPVDISLQEKFSRYLLALEGLQKSKLVLMSTEHPFTDHYGANDIRVTTHYYEENFISNIFSTLHEGGHALFMQNEPAELYNNHCADNMTNAMHECISRFFENIIGRSEAFIAFIMPKLRELSGKTFDDVSERELFEAVNIAAPGPIRMEADELTYPIHIMIRYELEKAFVNGDMAIEDIPGQWNKKYKEYLGVEVKNDEEGCLQDVHWSCEYGYFPSYALGNAYGAQLLHTMKKDFDFEAALRSGNLKKIGDWLSENAFSIASLSTPEEWIKAITGEELNVAYYLDYLEEKFTKLYF